MKDFKVGDKIKLIVNVGPCNESIASGGVRKGDTLTCVHDSEPLEGYRLGNGKVSCEWANCHKDYFEDKEMFDMKKEKWFIRTPTPEISKLVQEWLFAQGLYWAGSYGIDQIRYQDSEAIGHGYNVDGRFGHTPINWWVTNGYKEIKLTFETVLKSVEYPKTETPEQLQLAEVLTKISELQAQSVKLQELINK